MDSMIYFDHNATTPLLPEVRDVLCEATQKYWGNPSSVHGIGRSAFAELERARERLASLINAAHDEIYFTSGGTESDNLAIFGIMEHNPSMGFLYSAIEHPAVSGTAAALSAKGRDCRAVPVDQSGAVRLDDLSESLHQNVCLVSVMAASNEIGTVQPFERVGQLVSQSQAVYHCDAVQAFGKVPIDVKKASVDLMSFSAHKINGPKGIGALYVKRGVKIHPRFFGGYQERSIRPGTQNVPSILAFVKAAEIACDNMLQNAEILFDLTEYMNFRIASEIQNVLRNGDTQNRLPGTLNLCFPGVETQVLLASLDQEGICASGGSACHSGSIDPSAVLLAIGRRPQEAACAIRFSLGVSNTREEVDFTVEALKRIVERVRAIG